jgi:uncharacterized protein
MVIQFFSVSGPFAVKIVRKIGEVGRQEWDRLTSGASPFVLWDWLDALETSACVGEKTGWLPHHLVIEQGGRRVGACPMYLKLHSMGEFVFDYEWAELARELGIRYYPKLLVAVPFTPVTGPRFLGAGGSERRDLIRDLGRVLVRIAEENGLSSIHVNFCLPEEAEILAEIGFVRRDGIQFRWRNHGFSSFDDYLGAFRSERRNKVKRERRELASQGIAIRVLEGEAIEPRHLATMFRLYKEHVNKFYYGHQYLTRDFFAEMARRFTGNVCLILAERDSQIIAGTFNVQDEETFYGRYWGAFEDQRYLHFNVCYYAAIEHCIRKGLRRFEAGAGGSFKQLRGLEPEPTISMHYIVDKRLARVVERHLKQERSFVDGKRAALMEQSQLRKTEP